LVYHLSRTLYVWLSVYDEEFSVKTTISLSDAIRTTLNEDGSIDLVSPGSTLHLEPAAAARLGYLLDGQAGDKLRQIVATLTELRDKAPDPLVRRLAREVLRDRA
jgi:hypothetical protein